MALAARMRFLKRIGVPALAAIVAAATVAAAGAARAPSPTESALHALVDVGAPGAVVLVRDGHRTVRLSAGHARLSPKTRMLATDRFRVGSITKTFLTTVVLQLVSQGSLALDEPIQRWLPGVVPTADRVTLRHLLSHTSGIYNYTDDPAFLRAVSAKLTRVFTPDELIEIANAHSPLFEPGSSWAYSNTNYIVAGLVIEAVTGRSVAEELRARIFKPLGLRDTSFPTGPQLSGRYAHGYSTLQGSRYRDVSVASPSLAWAAGALVSSADDLATFYRALLEGRLLPQGLRRELMRLVPGRGYGLGIARVRLRCSYVWGHDGAVPGYLASAYSSGNGHRQVVVLVNKDDVSGGWVNELLDAAYCRAGR